MNFNLRHFALWLLIGLFLFGVFQLFRGGEYQSARDTVSFSQFIDKANQGLIQEVVIEGQNIKGTEATGKRFETNAPEQAQYINLLLSKGVSVTARPPSSGFSLLSTFLSWLPMLLIIAVWIIVMRQMQGSGSRTMGFGRSKAKLLSDSHEPVTFDDVAGVDEAKEDLQEIVEFLRDPRKFQRLGGRIPRGVLLVGPPGTGKTLLARSVAGEANVPFFTISGSDFVEMFVGVGASRVRDMFEQAKKSSPCIIFIDEIDAVGRHRGAGLGGGNDEREQTLNQLLVEMDGFEKNQEVIVIAATNRPDVLDPALLRPGRFDRQVVVPNPDIIGREKILKVHMRNVPLAPDVNVKTLARGTPGFSGADLMNLVNEAALLAARRGERLVGMREFEDAKDKVMMGAERRSLVLKEEEKRLTAYHEAGHALVALHMKDSDPIHKATIIPRGRALGMVMRLPEGDQVSLTRAKCKADLAVAMAGRIAEEMIFGHEKVTSGASSDIQMATKLARAMVTRYGMSERLGPLMYAENEEEVFLGHSVSRTQNLSDETQKLVDSEIKDFVMRAYNKAKQVLEEHEDQLHAIAKALLEYETLSGEEIRDLLEGKPPLRDEEPEFVQARSSGVPSFGPEGSESSQSLGRPSPQDPDVAEEGVMPPLA